jgi:photosystem II stability/assembly factor-like uncharacterized protein
MKTKYANFRTIASLLAMAVGWLAIGVSTSNATIDYWYNIGPSPINTLDTNGNIISQDAGRVPAVAVDPSNADHWLAGSALGGIWETTDAGNTWNPRTDNQASMAMGAITFYPFNPSRVYAGTGEPNFRGDDYAGAGLLASLDGGTHWQMLNTNFAGTSFSHIVVAPSNFEDIVVSTVRGGGGVGEESSGMGNVPGAPPCGVYTSVNGGTDFTLALTGQATALVASPNNFSNQYAGLGEIYGDPTNGVYRTTNDWVSFQQMQGPWIQTNFTYISIPIATNIVINCTNTGNGNCETSPVITYSNIITGTNITAGGRVTMAIAPSDPNTLYVGVAETRFDYVAPLQGIWMTTNAWADNPDWTLLPYPSFPPADTDDISTPRFWYMFDLLVDPNDSTILYLAEFDLWRFKTNAWTQIDVVSNIVQVHLDNHALTWVPDGGGIYQLLVGNDGGVYISDPGVSGGAHWANKNTGLRITEFYKGAVDVTGANTLALGGAQDDFTSIFTGNPAWPVTFGGDGGDCTISATDPLNDWAVSFSTLTDNYTSPNTPDIRQSKNGGKDYNHGADAINNGLPFSYQFYVHFAKAPYNDDLVIAGTYQLWLCANFFSGIPSWSTNGPEMFGTNGLPMPISAMAFAPSDTRGLMYAYGTEDGQLLITANGGGTWNNLDPGNVLPGRYVSGMAFSPLDTNTLYVSFSGYDESTPGHPGHLFKTSNAFAATPVWTNVSPPVDLPNDCVALDPNIPGNVYVGADQGVWNSGDGGKTWTHYGPATGMPNVPVYDLQFTSGGQLKAFTHGRGAYIFSSINLPIVVFPVGAIFHPTPNCLTCPPDIMWINPGDLESISVPLENIVQVNTVDLQVTMLPTSSVSPVSGTQDYGAVAGQGATVSRTFQFIAGGGAGGPGVPAGSGNACGDTGQIVLQLQDQGVDLGQVTIPFRFGVPNHPLIEDFEEVPPPPPMLSPGWTSMPSGSAVPWSRTLNPPPNIEQVGGEDGFAQPAAQNTSVFVPDTPGVGQSYLTSPPFSVQTPEAQVYFREAFDVSNAYDGGILEVAIGSGPFQEILSAGGSFVKDGYNMTLKDNNPLGPRPGWSGNSGGWVPVLVNLPPTAAGQDVQLRWHFAGSRGMPNGAWFVDSVDVTEPVCLPAVSNPVIVNPALNGHNFTFGINTVSGRNYVIEYTTSLTGAAWQTLETLPGNNSLQTISIPISSNTLFFRFIVQ